MQIPTQKMLLMFLIVILFGSAVGIWWRFFHKDNFVIKDVPFITIYNHTGKNAYIVNDLSAAVVSVLEFFGANFSDADYQKINRTFFDPEDVGKLYSLETLKDNVVKLGYGARVESIISLRDLKRYINPKTETPLIFSHLLMPGQSPLIQWAPFGVLVGVLEKENAVVINDYYFGYNQKIDWEEFKKIVGEKYLIIQPKNSVIEHKNIPYPERSITMNKATPLINKITLGRVALQQKQLRVASSYIKAAVKDENFDENVPPYYKVVALSWAAYFELELKKDPNKALEFAIRAKDLNHDLDKPFRDYWPGFEDRTNNITNKYSSLYFVLGRIYEAKNESELAKEAYQEAINVWSNHNAARDALSRLNNITAPASSL